MYKNAQFTTNNQKEVLDFMKAHPFVLLCGIGADGKPVATHIPVLIEEREGSIFLQAHTMRKQQHTLAFEQNENVLAVFQGAHCYVSARWYEPQNVASTWNYSSVHATGTLRLLDDDGLYAVLKNTTSHFEGSPHTPASMDKMDEAYIRSNMKAIIAFEIEVTQLEHVFKLSQNKPAKTQENIVQHLEQGNQDEQAVAADMKRVMQQAAQSK
ncbi:MAG: FMN-binding negative transcriptional regulator [Sediminibacterium sp.]|nr:FMN-binding negative transcriptional regulator [Sediminibacterium sp.]